MPLDQLREHPEVASGEVPGLLKRLAEVPDPRDSRGVRHRLAVVLALTACAVLAGVTSLLAVGEWIADAPAHVLEEVGARPDPLLPRRVLPAETTVRRLMARLDGDALDRAVGGWLADRRPKATGTAGLRGLAVDGKSLRGAAKAKGRKIHLLAPPASAATPATLAAPSHSSASDDHEPNVMQLRRALGLAWPRNGIPPGLCPSAYSPGGTRTKPSVQLSSSSSQASKWKHSGSSRKPGSSRA